MRISYRGALSTFANLMLSGTLFNKMKDSKIFRLYHQLALYCDVSSTK